MRDSFLVRFAVERLLTKLALGAFFGPIVGFFAAWLLGAFADFGILKFDLTMDAREEALKSDRWREDAKKAYDKASSKVHTEEGKRAIRQEYLEALERYAAFGKRVPGKPG